MDELIAIDTPTVNDYATGNVDEPVTCHECLRDNVHVDSAGFLASHRKPHTKRLCDGSGRHQSFNGPALVINGRGVDQ